MGIQINGTNDTISAADGGLDVDGLTLKSKTTTQRNAGVGTAIGSVIFNTTRSTAQVYTGSTDGWVDFGGNELFTATGGTEDTTSRSGYKIHTFTSPGTFTVSSGTKIVEYLVVAGGGSGGYEGGGGAGGMRTGTLTVEPGPYTVTRGAGGSSVTTPSPGTDGSNSVFGTITSTGGGGAGAYPTTPGRPGGSGGGGGSGPNNLSGGTGNSGGYTPAEGYPGGSGSLGVGGGGGGASEAGNTNGSGRGGDGLQSSITGSATYYAGGGAGSTSPIPATGVSGGLGGGGNAGPTATTPGTAGTANTGGGGGGVWSQPYPTGAGGSGIVIIAYQV